MRARQLALWLQLQREFHRRGLLGGEAVRRLEAVGMPWEPQVGSLVVLSTVDAASARKARSSLATESCKVQTDVRTSRTWCESSRLSVYQPARRPHVQCFSHQA